MEINPKGIGSERVMGNLLSHINCGTVGVLRLARGKLAVRLNYTEKGRRRIVANSNGNRGWEREGVHGERQEEGEDRRDKERQTGGQTDGQADRRQTDRRTDRKADRRTDRRTDRQADRRTDRQTD